MEIYEELVARGLIAQVTNEDEIREMINNGKATFYIGFDCTADSLHVGHFMALCLMKRLQMAGNKPIALIGDGTTLIGDPSGRTDMRQMLTEDGNVIEVEEPVGVVYHYRLALAEIDEFLHLTAEAFRVVIDIFSCQHFSHVCSAGGVAYHCRAAADERNGLVPRHLETLHHCERHKMTCRKAVCRAVEAYIKLCSAAIDKVTYFGLVRDLRDKSARL